MCVCVCVNVSINKGKFFQLPLPLSLSPPPPPLPIVPRPPELRWSHTGDGGQTVGGFLELLGLGAGRFWDGPEAEGQADVARGAHVAGAQRGVLSPIALHDAGGVGG